CNAQFQETPITKPAQTHMQIETSRLLFLRQDAMKVCVEGADGYEDMIAGILRIFTPEGTKFYPPSFCVQTREKATVFLRERAEEEGDSFFVFTKEQPDRVIGMVGILPAESES